jgi:plastocyanin
VLLLGLSSGQKLGIALMATVFAGFSLVVSMLVPRRWPQFPGRWLPAFLAVIVVLFVGMLTTVILVAKESKSEAAPGESATEQTSTSGGGGQNISVRESEFKIQLPKTTFSAGTYMFAVSNAGKLPHDLTITGPGGKEATSTIVPGGRGSVTAHLEKGTYDFYCSIPGHKSAGMDVKVTVS